MNMSLTEKELLHFTKARETYNDGVINILQINLNWIGTSEFSCCSSFVTSFFRWRRIEGAIYGQNFYFIRGFPMHTTPKIVITKEKKKE